MENAAVVGVIILSPLLADLATVVVRPPGAVRYRGKARDELNQLALLMKPSEIGFL